MGVDQGRGGNGANGILLTNGRAFEHSLAEQRPRIRQERTPCKFFRGDRPREISISGNAGDGLLLSDGATDNFLAGNFIGTAASGIKALGNAGDGVAIVGGSDGNVLAGTFQKLDPFIFYNVISGNKGNGLRISDSDNTTIHADFFGIG